MNNKHYVAALVLATAASAMTGVAQAVEPQAYRTPEDLLVTPLLTVRERYDDNIRATQFNPQSSFVTTLDPSVSVGAEGNKAAFNVTLDLPMQVYHSYHDNDHTDTHLTGSLDLDFDRRNRLGLDAGYHRQEEVASVVQNLQNDKWETLNASAIYGFGARTARAQVEVGARAEQVRFKNDLVLPSGALLNSDRDRDVSSVFGTFFVAVAPKTKLLLEARQTTYDYVSNPLLDSTNQALLAGVTWEATALTKGSVKVGSETKAFDTAGIPDANHSMWEAAVEWNPVSYSVFRLTTNSRLDEGTNGAYVIETQTVTLDWTHQWLKRLKSEIEVGSTKQDYVGFVLPSGQSRSDDITRAGFGLIYDMRRWLDVGVSYSYLKGDSNELGRSYDRNIIALTMDASL